MISDLSILVAESSESLRGLIVSALKTVGFRVVEAEDGNDALEKVQRSLFNLIILGLELPKLNSFDLIRELQSRQRLCRIPVLVVPGGSKQPRMVSLEGGVSFRIDGPGAAERVISAVRRHLD